MAVYGLTRASTIDQEQSPLIQEQQIRDLCKTRGLGEPIMLHERPGTSGTIPFARRKQGRWVLDNLKNGDTLVVTKVDRLGRRASDIQATAETLAERGVKPIIMEFFGLSDVDVSSPAGALLLGFFANVSQWERSNISGRAKDTHAYQRRNGYAQGPAPFGFKNVRMKALPGQRKPPAIVVPIQPAIIDEIVMRKDTGEPFYRIAADFSRRGLCCNDRPWAPEKPNYHVDPRRVMRAYRFWKQLQGLERNGLNVVAAEG